MLTRDNCKVDKWIDYLTANGYDIDKIYQGIIKRARNQPDKLKLTLINRTDVILSAKAEVADYFSKTPLYTHPMTVQHDLQKMIGLSKSHIEFFMNQYFWCNLHHQLVFDFLQKHNVKLKVKYFRCSYEVLLYITPQMQENFDKYGDVVHVSFNFVPIKRNSLMRTQYMGLFSGVSHSGQMTIFAISIIVGSTPEYRQLVINWFLQLVQPKKPLTLVGQLGPGIKKSIQKAQQQKNVRIKFYENWYYTLERAQKNLISEPSRKDIVKLLRKALKTMNRKQTEDIMIKICKTAVENNPRTIASFLRQTMSTMCCRSPAFIGFEVELSRYNMMCEVIKQQFPYCQTLGKFILRSLFMERKLSEIDRKSKPIRDQNQFFHRYAIAPTEQLQILCKSMKEQIFKKFIYNYLVAKSHCKISDQSSPLILNVSEVPQKNEQKLNQLHYTLKYDLKAQHWTCQCNMLCWSGLPCPHLIYIVTTFSGSILYYINSRWLIDKALRKAFNQTYSKSVGERLKQNMQQK